LKHTALLFTALLAAALPATACINEKGTNRSAESIAPLLYAGQKLKPMLVTPTSKAHLTDVTEGVVRRARATPSFNNLNDLAATLIRHGRLPVAVRLLQFLERKYPGHYETAANIGTAYELMGRNKDALRWISECMKRNPMDHDGTEWLHAHILKAKLGQLPKSAPGRSILNLDFGNDPLPRRPAQLPTGNDGKPLILFDTAFALRYQLLERIGLVAAPDPIVAGLLLDWANFELLAGTVESADVLYDAALRYGSSEGPLIARRKQQVASILSKPAQREGSCELCEPPHLQPKRTQ
jgi:hypothetical protein